jgi:hypothetical protein
LDASAILEILVLAVVNRLVTGEFFAHPIVGKALGLFLRHEKLDL